MSAGPRTHPETSLAGTPGRWPLLAVPSWLISLCLHGLLLFAFATGLKSCQRPDAGGSGELREVGIYVKNPGEFLEQAEKNVAAESDSQAVFEAQDARSEPALLDQAPPVDVETPRQHKPNDVLGPGSLAPSSAGSLPDPGDVLRPSGALGPRHPAGLKKGETSFFGIKDNANHFVYLLDRSGSMRGAPLRAAKAELMASIEALDAPQRFQVIFYNDELPVVLRLRSSDKETLYWATSINKTLARQRVVGIDGGGGTEHMPALRLALKGNPEVIFYLTDADEPVLEAGDLQDIKRLNGGRSRIHCVEFDEGPEQRGDNFLKQLARQSGGTYRYRNVTQLERQ